MRIIIIGLLTISLFSCSEHKAGHQVIGVNKTWLDSIMAKADTSWVKPYRNNEFVTSEYYIDTKDSIVTQLMKDSSGRIRQILIAKYDQVRLFYGEYYANGQLKASLPLDSAGRYHGHSRSYYEDGTIKAEGDYRHGFLSGEWKNFDEKGKLVRMDLYDSTGKLTIH